MSVTEDSVNSVIFSVLRNAGIQIQTQVTTMIYGKTFKPDFFIQNDYKVFGEGEWEKSIERGLAQAQTYLDSPDADASFTIVYPSALQDELSGVSTADSSIIEEILSRYSYHIYSKKRREPNAHRKVSYDELPQYIEEFIHRQAPVEPDVDIFINTINKLANKVFEILPAINAETLSLYQNILGSQDELKSTNADFERIAKNAAGYLFLNQLIFYSILSFKHPDYPPIIANNLNNFDDLKQYFLKVLAVDFKPVFSIDVISQFVPSSIDTVKDIILAIQFLGAEYIQSDVIGRIFHKLIPDDIRTEVAAYYTKPESAELLAYLSITDPDINIIDPACGSGQLLIAAYQRMKQLYEINNATTFDDATHKDFLEHRITGIDIMPFSAHLSVINLTLQNIEFIADYMRVAIFDSTKLVKGLMITPLQSFLQQVQVTLTSYMSGKRSTKKSTKKTTIKSSETKGDKLIGTITLDGKAGVGFSIDKISNVIMNPPFTRQEIINKLTKTPEKAYKKQIIENIVKPPFAVFKNYLNEQQPFSTYFLLIADKILEDKGTLAAVLPATILRDDVNQDVRNYFWKNYTIKYIIIRFDALNFSDDTTFREILLVMKKEKPTADSLITYITINNLTSKMGSTVKMQEDLIDDMEIHQFNGFNIQKIHQLELDSTNLFSPLALSSAELQEIWQDASRVRKFISNKTPVVTKEGARSRHYGLIPEMSIVEELGRRTIFKFSEIQTINSEQFVKFKSIGDIEYTIPMDNVFGYVRDASNNTMNLTNLNEFVIWKVDDSPFFDEIEAPIQQLYKSAKRFDTEYRDQGITDSSSMERSVTNNREMLNRVLPDWTNELLAIVGISDLVCEARKIIQNGFTSHQDGWKRYLEEKLCYLGAIETFHIEAPNTFFYAFYSGDSKRIFSSIFNNIISLEQDAAKINCLWLNSSVNIIQLFCEQVPTGWFKIRQYVLESLKLLDITKLSEEDKTELLSLFDEISLVEFPSVWRQILCNVSDADVPSLNQTLIKSSFNLDDTTYSELINHPFEPRRRMDILILKVLFPRKKADELEVLLNQIYYFLINEIVIAKQLVSNV